MERYSKFNDPFTGINPFLAPKYVKITWKVAVTALLKLPLWILYLLGFNTLGMLIHISCRSKIRPCKRIVANSVTAFDRTVIGLALGIDSRTVLFPEGTNTNNLGVLDYKGEADFAIGLKYSPECIYMYGSYFKWIVRFLGSKNRVEVCVEQGSDISKSIGLQTLKLNAKDKAEFMRLIK